MPRDKRAWLFKRNERPGWWVGWYHNGKLRKKKFDTKSAARRYARKLEGELNANIYYEPSRKTWPQFIDEYKENQQPLKKHRTCQEENSVLRHFTEFSQPGLLVAISMNTIEKYLAHRRKTGISPATYNKDLRILRLVFNYAVKKRYLKENPTLGLDFASVDQTIPRILEPEEFAKILRAVEDPEDEAYSLRWRTVLSVLWSTGVRPSELVAVTVKDINLSKATIKIHAGKTHKERVVSIFFKDVVAVLAQYIERMPAEQKRLFTCHSSRLTKEFRDIREEAGLPDVVLYDLRKTFGSVLAQNGVSTAVTQKLLEHSSPDLTNKMYTNVDPVLRHAENQIAAGDWL